MVDKKVIIGPTSDSVVKPGDVTQISPIAGNADEDSVETSNIARIKTTDEQAQQPKKTIKLKPVTVGDATAAGESAAPGQEDETVKIQKPRPVATPTVPGVKQTIKLRPSSNTPAPDSTEGAAPAAPPPAAPQATEGATAAKRTIRLVPKKADATSGGEAAPSAKPSAPTVKLEEPSTQAVPRSAVTVKLEEPQQQQAAAAPSAPPKRTLKLKPVKSGGEAAPAAPAMPPPTPSGATDSEGMAAAAAAAPPVSMPQEAMAGMEEKGADEPSMLFTLAACVTLLVMIYFTWAVVGQFCNNYLDSKISVPGLSDKVK